jgi:DNA repair photolyase
MDSPGRTGFRWSVADAAATSQLALFDEPECVIGKGEFRGLEFIHVNARRILNRVPDRSPIPFRWTINAYRGCSHACTFCFARPTHEYLNLDPATDFDRVIVVKTNAVERLRAELAPSRWAGESIAMGTNTDPYQRAEGKYRLTRGVVEVLGEAANPFSILTKGTLILRDLDVLADAARVTSVECCFSVGTLDEEVWRMTEPGTPHPRKRLEAVARLNEAGVPCGVLMGPIIPGLSDRPDQIDAVVAGCVDAGATTIGHVVLHLRPGVREHWMTALGATRPDLVSRHEELYRSGAYAPRLERARIGRLVEEALQRHRRGRRDGGHTRPISARFQPTAP